MLYSLVVLVLLLPLPAWAAEPALDEQAAAQFDPGEVRSLIQKYQDEAVTIRQQAAQTVLEGVKGEQVPDRVKRFAQQIRESLGIPKEEGHLYVFVSHSMPDNMLRAYLLEGAWAGAGLVLRGIPPGMTLKQYLVNVMHPLVKDQGGAGMAIDPRLFDIYQIQAVPTIVWQPGILARCNGTEKTPRRDALGELREVQACAPETRSYWQLSGAVTLDYALKRFAEEGAPGAEERLNVLRANVTPTPGQVAQQPFEGDWAAVEMPGDHALAENLNAYMRYTQELVSDTPPINSPNDFSQ